MIVINLVRVFRYFREELDRTLARLEAVWDDIGLNEEQRKERRHHFNGHIVVSCHLHSQSFYILVMCMKNWKEVYVPLVKNLSEMELLIVCCFLV